MIVSLSLILGISQPKVEPTFHLRSCYSANHRCEHENHLEALHFQDVPKPATAPVDEKKAKELARFQAELQEDKKLGKEAADYYDRQYPPTSNKESQLKVEEIGGLLASVANANPFPVLWGDKRHAEFDYRFRVVDSKEVNAFSLPGGYIYVYQGLVDFCESDDELAGVLAHEICHASQRHIATLRKEQSKASAFQIPLILASIFTGGVEGALFGSMMGTAITNGWSQKAETSADAGGFELMVAGGYNPTGLITFMERLQLKDGLLESAFPLGILRTHPPSRVRADRIEQIMQKNNMAVRRSQVTMAFRAKVRDENNVKVIYFGRRKLYKLGGADAAERGAVIAKRLNDFFDGVPEMFEVTVGEQGEIFGKNRMLIRLTEADAAANDMTLAKLQESVANGVRSSIFNLAYHIWESRG